MFLELYVTGSGEIVKVNSSWIYQSHQKVEYSWEGAAWKGGNLLSRTFSWSFDVKTDRVGAGPCRFAIIVSV